MCRERSRTVALAAETLNPDYLATLKTYCHGANTTARTVPMNSDGATDIDALKELLTPDVACLIIQQPNFFGVLEDTRALFALARSVGVKCVEVVNPIALGLMETPRDSGADIAVGEGQPLGLPLAFGGPYLGFMACEKSLMRRLPGRIVGETTDKNGVRAFVLTLQAREQHIRREKAGSNVCSNEALCALRAAVYLAAVGPDGLKQAAALSMSKAHYLAEGLRKIGFTLAFDRPFFHEFLTDCPIPFDQLEQALASVDVLCGLKTDKGVLWCVTEVVSKAELDRTLAVIKEVSGR